MDPEGTLDDLLDMDAIPDFETFAKNIGKAKDRLKELEDKGIVEPDNGKVDDSWKETISMVQDDIEAYITKAKFGNINFKYFDEI